MTFLSETLFLCLQDKISMSPSFLATLIFSIHVHHWSPCWSTSFRFYISLCSHQKSSHATPVCQLGCLIPCLQQQRLGLSHFKFSCLLSIINWCIFLYIPKRGSIGSQLQIYVGGSHCFGWTINTKSTFF